MKLLVRIPMIALSLYVMDRFVKGNVTELWYFVFYGVYCIDYIVGQVLHIVEENHFHSEPPSILEYGAALYFSPQIPEVHRTLHQLIYIQLTQMILFHVLGIFGYLYSHRLYATGVVSVIEISHAVYVLWHNQPYPTMMYLERMPELMVIAVISLFAVVYSLGCFVANDWSMKPAFLQVDFSSRQEFRHLLRNWAECIVTSSKRGGYQNEMNPVFAPAGVGMVPRILLKKRIKSPLDQVYVDPILKKDTPSFGFYHLFKLWGCIIQAPIMFLWTHIVPLFKTRQVEDFEESDEEYQPSEMEESSDSEWSDEDDNVYKELFYLVQDVQRVDPTFSYASLFHPTPIQRNSSQRNTDRVCVVCQTSTRSIILRPCGCLCLCGDCRESLALRGTDMCPCCRRTVQGYQKLFVP
jgi:hypothetical protein